MGTNNLHGESIMLKEKNRTCNSAIYSGQHRPRGGGLTLGGTQGGLGDLKAELETHNFTNCLRVQVACPLPPMEVAPSVVSIVGVTGAARGTCCGCGFGTASTMQAKLAIQMVLFEQNRISGMNIYMRSRRIKIFLPLMEKGTERQIAFWSSICRALVLPTHGRLRLSGHGD